jgi:hypothetical protein
LLSESHLQLNEGFLTIPKYHIYQIVAFPGAKGRASFAFSNYVNLNRAGLPPVISTEATEVSVSSGKSEIVLPAVHRYLGGTCSDAYEDVKL